MNRTVALLLVAAASALAAEMPLEVVADPVVRGGLIYRCRIHSSTVITRAASVTVTLVDGERILAAGILPLASANQLALGVTMGLTPMFSGVAPHIDVRVADDADHALARIAQPLAGIGDNGLRDRMRAQLTAQAVTDPLPWLWLEQCDELAVAPIPTVAAQRELQMILARLQAWPARTDVNDSPQLLAFRDPVDTSVQPARLTLPAGSGSAPPVVVVMRSIAVSKSIWEPLPVAWTAAAAQAGVAVLEVYPAGDLAFTGAARRRIPLALAAARLAVPYLGSERLVVGDERLATVAGWKSATAPIVVQPQLSRLAAWTQGPFVVVVGTGESRAARTDARNLADAFVRAWAAHAHGLPPVVDDTAFRQRDWPGHHVVFIGSPRGNSALAELADGLPVTWDDRMITIADRQALRSRLPGLAVARPLPGNPQLTMLVLDGRPAWSASLGECPLMSEALTADVVLNPGSPSEGAPLRLLLESLSMAP